MKTAYYIFLLFFIGLSLQAEDGHDLWLRYKGTGHVSVTCSRKSATLDIAIKELQQGWQGNDNAKIVLTVKNDKAIKQDGFRLSPGEIQANTDLGILYGVYELLRRQYTGQPVVEVICNPSYEVRILNHWDMPDSISFRGFGNRSVFWKTGKNAIVTTDADKKLWQEYARANASIGINGVVPNIVNASPIVVSEAYLERLKDIAAVLRPYGVKTYLAVNFAFPSIIGGLETSDPLDPNVIKWWSAIVKEIYSKIPDFGGFIVKANSEGMQGPHDYGRNHAQGANVLADALKPYGGIVMWRAFVYSPTDKDRAKQAYLEFINLDGQFRDNVIIQVKNGPIDFQPREPFSPLFGAMKHTSIMPEFEIMKEYLGGTIHLVFLGTMWEECLKSETYQEGPGSTVGRCTDGSIIPQKHTGIAGVANVSRDTNWCGHPFDQANWYAFGRLAWDNTLTSEKIADEWIKLTFSQATAGQPEATLYTTDWKEKFLEPVKKLMLESREAAVNYMMPLGFHHIFSMPNTHYGPGPWWAPEGTRPDWTPPYYHQADANGVGFDRTLSGTDGVSQYHEPLASQLNDLETCPEIFLLWFHHVPWNYKMKNGRTLWDEICYHYAAGVLQVRGFQKIWDQAEPYVDKDRFTLVQSRMREQYRNAVIWKDACLQYFQLFSQMPVPYDIERPIYDLDFLMKHHDNYRGL